MRGNPLGIPLYLLAVTGAATSRNVRRAAACDATVGREDTHRGEAAE